MRVNLGCVIAMALTAGAGTLRAEKPVYAVKVADEAPYSMIDEIIKCVPPLKHERGQRWPMILWDAGPFAAQPVEYYRQLLARGLTQHIQMTTNHLAAAKALQAAGSPVIMMQGAGGPWPANLAGDPKNWAHQFVAGYQATGYVKPCLAVTEGWAIQADNVRQTLRTFRDAGVTVNAVWMDWEGDPLGGREAYEQATHCTRCQATLPPSLRTDPEVFHAYRWRLYMDLLSAYLAAPVNEVFPGCETTNWMITISTPDRPLRFWNDKVLAPSMPAVFTATNPIAYGNTVYWKSWNSEWVIERELVDQFYTHLLLRMVSDDAANRARWAPYLRCFPWVDRWCPDDEDPQIPILSRERYREVLRHLWLRGVTGMQIFNPKRAGFKELVLAEVEDAVAVYDEMLADREFLDGGQPLCFDVPGKLHHGVIWSGLRLGNRAVVRTFKPGGGEVNVSIEPWPGKVVLLPATSAGRTYHLDLETDDVHVRELPGTKP